MVTPKHKQQNRSRFTKGYTNLKLCTPKEKLEENNVKHVIADVLVSILYNKILQLNRKRKTLGYHNLWMKRYQIHLFPWLYFRCSDNRSRKKQLREKEFISFYTSRLQSMPMGSKGRNLKQLGTLYPSQEQKELNAGILTRRQRNVRSKWGKQ